MHAGGASAKYVTLRWTFQSEVIPSERLIGLGDMIENPQLKRTHDAQITLADLTGVAVQDIQVAKLALQAQARVKERS